MAASNETRYSEEYFKSIPYFTVEYIGPTDENPGFPRMLVKDQNFQGFEGLKYIGYGAHRQLVVDQNFILKVDHRPTKEGMFIAKVPKTKKNLAKIEVLCKPRIEKSITVKRDKATGQIIRVAKDVVKKPLFRRVKTAEELAAEQAKLVKLLIEKHGVTGFDDSGVVDTEEISKPTVDLVEEEVLDLPTDPVEAEPPVKDEAGAEAKTKKSPFRIK